jgi:hypothetical protein
MLQSMKQLSTLAFLLLAIGCGGSDDRPSQGGPKAPDHTTFDVEWADNTRVIDEASGKAHLAMAEPPNADTLTYTFDHEASAIAALGPGEIAVLSGIAYRKVVSVTDTGTGYELVTERTTLPEAMKSGTIDYLKNVEFNALPAGTQAYALGKKLGTAQQGLELGPVTYTGEVQGYGVSLTLTPSAGRLDVAAAIQLEVAGEKRFGIDATGFIEGFQTQGHATVGEGALLEFHAGQNEVRGELHVKAAAFNTGLNDNLLDIPIGIDIPLEVGPVPMILKIKANINVRLILSITDSSAEAEANFTFASDQGVELSGTSLNATGALETGDMEGFLGGSVDSVAAGMSACFEVPRFELTMLGEFASVGITQNNCVNTTFTFNPACNEVRGAITGIALAQLGFFGVTLASGQVELYSREDGISAGQCD